MGSECVGLECCTSATLSKIERFEMVIFEAPEKVVQVVTYDNERGLKFVDVPKHRDLMKTRHVTDIQDARLTLQVYEEAKTCMVGKPRFHLKPKQEKEVLCSFNEEFNSTHMFSSENSTARFRSLMRTTIQGAGLPTGGMTRTRTTTSKTTNGWRERPFVRLCMVLSFQS